MELLVGLELMSVYDSFDGVKRAVEIMKALVLMLCEIFLSCFASIKIATQQS